MSEIVSGIISVLLVCGFIFGVVFGVYVLVENSNKRTCVKNAEIYGHPTKYYGGDTGCIMDINGQKIRVAV